jgi:DNA primase
VSSRPLSPESRRSLETAAATFHAALPGSPAEAYLAARGISPASSERFRLGFVSEAVPGYEQFLGRLAIPNICGGDRPHVVGIDFRALGDAEPKYLRPSGMETRMFNTRALDEAEDTLCITEGQFDTIVLEQLGLHSVAILGVDGWKSHYWRLLEGFTRLVLFRDNDEAGKRLEAAIRKTDLPLTCYVPPGVGEKGDVSESFLNGHGDDLVRLALGTHQNGVSA